MANEVREVQFFDGEGLDPADLNNLQRHLRAQLWDLAVSLRIRNGVAGVGERTGVRPGETLCFALGGGGYIEPGASARQLVSARGLIGQCLNAGVPDGTDPLFLTYYLNTQEIDFTTAIGDATNPRIDLVCIKLEHEAADAADNVTRDFKDATTGLLSSQTFAKKRKVKMSAQLVAGTPAASPTEPAVPAGFVKLAGILVPATHNTTHDWLTNGRDYRMPANSIVQNTYTFGNGGGVNVESGWATAITSGGLQSSAASQVVRIFPPAHGFFNARLLRARIVGDLSLTTPATVEVIRRFHAATAGGDTDTVLATGTASGYLGSATEAFWMNGRRGGVQLEANGGAQDAETIGLKITSGAANQIIRFVRWELAGV